VGVSQVLAAEPAPAALRSGAPEWTQKNVSAASQRAALLARAAEAPALLVVASVLACATLARP
jgi:hypothetical protein